MDFPKYPIYNIQLRWIQDRTENAHPNWVVGDRRQWNSSGGDLMLRERDDEKALGIAYKWWAARCRKQKADRLSKPLIWLNEPRYEEWVLTWFQHHTFDVGQSDAEALDSFQAYVNRQIDAHGGDRDKACLMGAEDRWRWRGDARNGTPAPCRCRHCKKQGVLRIGH